jgi:hypothetical protein
MRRNSAFDWYSSATEPDMDFHLRGDRSRKHNYRDAHSTKSLWRCTSEGSLVVAALCASFSGIGASDPITALERGQHLAAGITRSLFVCVDSSDDACE